MGYHHKRTQLKLNGEDGTLIYITKGLLLQRNTFKRHAKHLTPLTSLTAVTP